MTKACIAIIIIVLISSYICTRNGYKNVGNSILPVALVPVGHIIGTGIVVRLMKAGGLLRESAAAMSIATAVDVAACVAGCALVMSYIYCRTLMLHGNSNACFAYKLLQRILKNPNILL